MTVSSSEHQPVGMYQGSVKWFNNKSGFGFITVVDSSDYKDKDIFVHHSSIVVKDEQYKYLVQGEYVTFNISQMDTKDHDNQAINVTGIGGGDLMCETRNKNKTQPRGDNWTDVKRGRKPHRKPSNGD